MVLDEIIQHLATYWPVYFTVIVPLAALYLEHYVHVIPRMKRRWAWLLNRRALVRLTLRYPLTGTFESAKETLKNVVRASAPIEVARDGPVKMAISTRGLHLTLTQDGSAVQIEMNDYSAPLRAIRADVLSVLELLESLPSANFEQGPVLGPMQDAQVTLELPYEWENIRLAKLRKWIVSSYRIDLDAQRSNCTVAVSMRRITITSKSQNALGQAIADLI